MTPERGDSWKIVEAVHNDPDTKARFGATMAIFATIPGKENFTDVMGVLVDNLKGLKQDNLADRAQTIINNYNNKSPHASDDEFNSLKIDVEKLIDKLSQEDSSS